MTSIANPNWLAISAIFFIVIGLGILARAFIGGPEDQSDSDVRSTTSSRQHVNLWTGGPLLAIGFFAQAASQLGSVPFNGFIVLTLLALAFGLLLYGLAEDTLADLYRDRSDLKTKPAKLAVVPSSVIQIDTVEVIEPRRLEASNKS